MVMLKNSEVGRANSLAYPFIADAECLFGPFSLIGFALPQQFHGLPSFGLEHFRVQ